MFRDAAHRVFHAADAIGIRGIVVQAISEEASRFYVALGFDACPREATTLDERSLNINTFPADYVLMGYALPEEAHCPAVH
jgi:hypothetical protein